MRQGSPTACQSIVFALFAAVAMLGVASPAHAQQTIKIDDHQVATVIGSWRSLQSLVEDLCFRARVELRGYDAPDRPAAAHYQDLGLAQLFRRLLSRESFVLTVSSGHGANGLKVTSLRVMGDGETARANRRKPSRFRKASRPWQPPPSLLGSVFGEDLDEDRQAALRQLANGILANKADLEGFLDTDPGQMAKALERYPNAAQMLRELRAQQAGGGNEEIAEKLSLLINALEGENR